jgi:RNA polymerase sigma-70 factor (ECF subfamily)
MTGSEQDRTPERPSDDTALIAEARLGGRQAFETLVRRYERLVFRVAGGFWSDRAAIEDIAQETFLRAFQALPRFRAGAPFGPWISRIAVRLCYDRLRRRRSRREIPWQELSAEEQHAAQHLAAGRAPDEAAAARDLAGRLLDRLAPRDRQVLILVDALGYTAAEAAELSGCTGMATRLRLHRARKRARALAMALLAGANRDSGEQRGGTVQADSPTA